jgi:endonuclease/exonuclease/phosphatase family metal-dependent hydrolase
MPFAHNPNARSVESIVKFVRKQPYLLLVALLVVVLLVLVAYLLSRPRAEGKPGEYLFCSWNVENFYDDQDDPKNDDKMEDWFARNPDKFRLKTDRLAEALLMMNDGRGPDIMALYEVENDNCLNALKGALNDRLDKAGNGDQKYEHVLFKIDNTGRRFAPGTITRLPVDAERTHKFAKHPNGRTLESHINVQGHHLAVLAAHWTSRVDHAGRANEVHANAERRMSYAKDCYGRFRAILNENADADVILCGDFNDEFSDASMQLGLHASANVDDVKNAIETPRPLALLASLSQESGAPGTIYHNRKWFTFDHICISRGLLDSHGWTCDPASARIFAPDALRNYARRNGDGEPKRFGDWKTPTSERGYSDHFPVTVRLRVAGSESK